MITRCTSWVYVAAVLLLTIVSTATAKYSGGRGVPNDPYQVATAADLIALGETAADYDKHFILTADIDLDPKLPGGKVFERAVIASDANDTQSDFQGTPFTGVLDGSGHTLSRLTIQGVRQLGLFGELASGAKVKNLGLVDVNIIGSGDFVGGLVGISHGAVTRCYAVGTVSGTEYVGGLMGDNDWSGIVTQCYSTGIVIGQGAVGGLVGASATGDVTDCYSIARVSGRGAVGGVVGYMIGGSVNPSVTRCYSAGAISGGNDVGGVVGSIDIGGFVISCFWDMATSGLTENGDGMGKTTTEMQTAKTFLDAGWDFVGETANGTQDIWKIAEGMGYPRLAWEKYSGGTGEPNDPYQIATAADLIALGETPDDYGKHFILTADIDLDPNLPGRKVFDKAVIAPDTNDVADDFQGTAFSGVFDGNGHTISHLTITGNDYLGLFGQLGYSGIVPTTQIRDSGVIDVNIVGSGESVGGLVGYNDCGTVTRCYSTGVVSGTQYIGGLVGYNVGYTMGYYNSGSVTQCYSTGTVRGSSNVGGLMGYDDYSTVTHCYSTGAVNGTGDYVGGLVGGSRYPMGVLWGTSHGPTACFWDIQTSGQATSAAGTGKTTAEMQDPNTFMDAGWDFVGEVKDGLHEIWQMPQEGGYPVLSVFNGYAPPQLQGSGTADDPYLISDALELGAIVYYRPGAHYRLAASIDLSGIRWSIAVIPSFGGIFDGNDLTISRLTIIGKQDLGLFGSLASGAQVKDLGVVDVNIIGRGATTAGLVGYNDCGTVTRCYSTGVVTGRIGLFLGGLVGVNSGTVTKCHSESVVTGSAPCAGGLVGANLGGTVTRCYSAGVVSGRSYVGGLVGSNAYGTVNQCYSTGAVSGGTSVGGLLGYNDVSPRDGSNISPASLIQACFWDTQTSGQASSAAGTGKTTGEMQTAKTFLDAGWDFVGETVNGPNDVWKMAEGLDYPRLCWEPYDGQVMRELGQVFAVTLESNPTTGYRWEWVDSQDSILEQIGEAQFKPRETGDPPLVGAGGWESFDFKAVHQGQMTLKLVYRRPWEEGVEALKTFSLQVTVP